IYVSIAIVFIGTYDRSKTKNILRYAFPLFVAVLALFGFFYQPDYLYNGAYYHGAHFQNESDYFEYSEHSKLLFAKQTPYSFVSVVENAGVTYVKINGRSEASLYDASQYLMAHLPLLFHKDPRAVINVGHGGGYTLKTITMYPEVQSIDNVEIDKVIIEADQYVKDNGDPLSDPRVNLIIADARNYLFGTDKKYDVIMTQSSHVWANPYFFTKEFYLITKGRLNEGGIYSIWLPFYEMTEYDYATILATIQSVFSHIAQFYLKNTGAVIILASECEIKVPEDFISQRLRHPAIRSNFEFMKSFSKQTGLSSENFILNQYYSNQAVEQQLRKWVGEVDSINTDDLPVLEFNTLRNKYAKFRKG
ncbi:MAG: hypothetical protein JSV16_12570, partial [Candidatus Hydrogenedentota bacterium]